MFFWRKTALCFSKCFLWFRKGKIIKAKISLSERLKETLYWQIQVCKANNRLGFYFDYHAYYDEILLWDITDLWHKSSRNSLLFITVGKKEEKFLLANHLSRLLETGVEHIRESVGHGLNFHNWATKMSYNKSHGKSLLAENRGV